MEDVNIRTTGKKRHARKRVKNTTVVPTTDEAIVSTLITLVSDGSVRQQKTHRIRFYAETKWADAHTTLMPIR